jgi:GTP-binding protein
MALPIVAVVGRPNVGKSTLFNRLTRTHEAVVHEESGVTRDRHLRACDWNGVHFLLADTGGIVPDGEQRSLDHAVTEIARDTIRLAEAVLFMVDVGSGIASPDEIIARQLRGVGKPVFVVANKAESENERLRATEFYRLGLGPVFPVSALHGEGTGDLLDAVVATLPLHEPEPAADLRVAVVGRPNVGKSSLTNRLCGEERTLVSDIPGTTRDSIDTRVRWHGHDVVLVDTAGIRRKAKHEKGVEYFSTLRSLRAIERCDVAVLLLDAAEGMVAQDARIAGAIHDAGRGAVIAVNKWDAVQKETQTLAHFTEGVRSELAFLNYAPVVSISATAGLRTGRILQLAWEVGQERQKTVETSLVNAILEKAQAQNQPKVHNRGTGRIYYGTQTGVAPPTFTLFVNRAEYFGRNYMRYLSNQVRERIGFKGTRIQIELKERR